MNKCQAAPCQERARVRCEWCHKRLCVWCFQHGVHRLTLWSWLRCLGRNPT